MELPSVLKQQRPVLLAKTGQPALEEKRKKVETARVC